MTSVTAVRRARVLLAVCGLAAAACLAGCDASGEHTRTSAYGVDAVVRTLVVRDGTGDVHVTGGGSGVHVSERQTYRHAAPHTTHTVSGTTLTLAPHCDDCSVGYDIRVPAGTTVDLVTGTGGVRVDGTTAPVTAGTGTGDVTAAGLTGSTVRLTTGTGTVDAAFAAAPGSLDVHSGTGAVTLTLPRSARYAVTARTGTGRTDVAVSRDAAAPHRVTASVDTGDLTIRNG